METIIQNVKDSNLKLCLAFGVGIHHAGLHEKDRQTVEELFVNQKIQVTKKYIWLEIVCKKICVKNSQL